MILSRAPRVKKVWDHCHSVCYHLYSDSFFYQFVLIVHTSHFQFKKKKKNWRIWGSSSWSHVWWSRSSKHLCSRYNLMIQVNRCTLWLWSLTVDAEDVGADFTRCTLTDYTSFPFQLAVLAACSIFNPRLQMLWSNRIVNGHFTSHQIVTYCP